MWYSIGPVPQIHIRCRRPPTHPSPMRGVGLQHLRPAACPPVPAAAMARAKSIRGDRHSFVTSASLPRCQTRPCAVWISAGRPCISGNRCGARSLLSSSGSCSGRSRNCKPRSNATVSQASPCLSRANDRTRGWARAHMLFYRRLPFKGLDWIPLLTPRHPPRVF